MKKFLILVIMFAQEDIYLFRSGEGKKMTRILVIAIDDKDCAIAALQKYEGEIIHTSLPPEAQESLLDALS